VMTDSKGKSTVAWLGLALALGLAGATTSAAHEEPAPVNEGWAGGISAAITAQTGQVDTFAGTIDAVGERTFEKDWLRGRFNGVYGTSRDRGEEPSSRDTVLQDAQGLFGDWKRTVHNRFFWQSGSELSRNSVQDRMVRALLSTGPGYRFWEGENAPAEHFDTNLGVGYRYDLYDPDTDPGGPGRGRLDHNHFADLVAGFEYRNGFFQDKVEFTHTGTARMPTNDPDAYVLITELIFGIPLTPTWSFRTSYYVEYNAVQPDDVKNVTTRASVGLGYTF
jgi:putative salt-induced outer membrane protein YdiY